MVIEPVEPHSGAATFGGIAHLRLNVCDVQRSVRWYRDVMGFSEPAYIRDLALLAHADAQFELVLRAGRTLADDSGHAAFDHVAFRVRDRAELEAWVERLKALGLDVHIARAIGGMSISLEDPDGNDLELFLALQPSV